MTNKSFDFNKIQRSYYNIKLKNGKTLIISMPKKRIFEKMQKLINLDEENSNIEEAFRNTAILVTEILNDNKQKIKIELKEIEDNYNFEELIAFVQDYAEFVNTLSNNPN